MNIKILVFGVAKDIVGGTDTEASIRADMTVAALRIQLEGRHPRLKQLSTYMVAVNNEYATNDTIIHEGDEIAIIPPVSGG
jgi:molybdopterin synthase sulfur carrier subunit